MPTTYILRCIDNRYYVGSTVNLNRRLIEHTKKKCKFTKSRLPIKLVYKKDYLTLSEARKRELQIKGRKSRNYVEKLIKS